MYRQEEDNSCVVVARSLEPSHLCSWPIRGGREGGKDTKQQNRRALSLFKLMDPAALGNEIGEMERDGGKRKMRVESSLLGQHMHASMLLCLLLLGRGRSSKEVPDV